MLFRLLLISLLAFLLPDGPGDGRKGNTLYAEGKYAEAAEAYRQGLASLGDAQSAARYGLLNNLGSALYRMGQFDEARKVFQEAALAAGSDAERSRALYNAGNAAYGEESLEEALEQYRNALLADSRNEDARFNYEFVKRKLDEQQQQQQQGNGQNQDEQQDQNSENNSGQQNEPQDQNEGQDPQQNQSGEDSQQSEGDQQERPQNEQEQQQPGEDQQADPGNLSREQAERILQALQGDEERLLREVQKQRARPQDVEKDW